MYFSPDTNLEQTVSILHRVVEPVVYTEKGIVVGYHVERLSKGRKSTTANGKANGRGARVRACVRANASVHVHMHVK
jgi:hypothetical protein